MGLSPCSAKPRKPAREDKREQAGVPSSAIEWWMHGEDIEPGLQADEELVRLAQMEPVDAEDAVRSEQRGGGGGGGGEQRKARLVV